MESGTQAASVEGRKNQVFGGFAGCGGRWVAQTAPKHALEPPGRAVPPWGVGGAAMQLQPPQLDFAAFRDMAEVAVCPAIKSVVGGFR